MKPKINSVLIGLALLAGVHPVLAQNPVITSFTQNGVLVCSNLQPGSVATVLASTTVNGPWTTNAEGLSVAPDGTLLVSGLVSGSGSKFYRVRGVAPVTGTNGMVLIPAGAFTMGNTIGDPDITDANPTTVYVSAFYMDSNLVSWSQWQTVYNYATNQGYGFFTNTTITGAYVAGGKAGNHPVQTVNWWDCVKWSNARSVLAGLTPVYYTDAGLTQVYRNGEPTTVYPMWGANGYRLPTEAEWEKAARGGLSGQRFPWGNTISESEANYSAQPTRFNYDLGPYNAYNSNFNNGGLPYTSPVGYFAPNEYGLYDMAGNLWEWCWDWYAGPPYPAGSPYSGGADPRGAAIGINRVDRGGSWDKWADGARCAFRSYGYPSYALNIIGFRCVRGL